jgi:MFS family permease
MVFTHLPSSICLALIPLPNEVHFSLVLLVLRACTQSMDGPPRSAFMAAIVLPEERTAVMGLINVVKSTGMSIGPLLTGVLVDRGLFWVAFVCAGSLKATYDLGLLAVFKNHEREKAERERLQAAAAAEQMGPDEERVPA